MLYGTGDIIRIIVSCDYLAQECLNVFHYRVTNVNPESMPTEYVQGTQLFDNLYEEILDIQSFLVTYNFIKVINLSQGAKPFFVASLQGAVGAATGDAYPSSVAYGFKMNVSSSKTKAGGKRFVGVPESIGAGNSIVSSQYTNMYDIAFALQALNGIQNTLGDTLVTMQPVILKKYVTEFPAISDWQDVTGCTPNLTLTTQNSRKPK
jgi:hypothetical protein